MDLLLTLISPGFENRDKIYEKLAVIGFDCYLRYSGERSIANTTLNYLYENSRARLLKSSVMHARVDAGSSKSRAKKYTRSSSFDSHAHHRQNIMEKFPFADNSATMTDLLEGQSKQQEYSSLSGSARKNALLIAFKEFCLGPEKLLVDDIPLALNSLGISATLQETRTLLRELDILPDNMFVDYSNNLPLPRCGYISFTQWLRLVQVLSRRYVGDGGDSYKHTVHHTKSTYPDQQYDDPTHHLRMDSISVESTRSDSVDDCIPWTQVDPDSVADDNPQEYASEENINRTGKISNATYSAPPPTSSAKSKDVRSRKATPSFRTTRQLEKKVSNRTSGHNFLSRRKSATVDTARAIRNDRLKYHRQQRAQEEAKRAVLAKRFLRRSMSQDPVLSSRGQSRAQYSSHPSSMRVAEVGCEGRGNKGNVNGYVNEEARPDHRRRRPALAVEDHQVEAVRIADEFLNGSLFRKMSAAAAEPSSSSGSSGYSEWDETTAEGGGRAGQNRLQEGLLERGILAENSNERDIIDDGESDEEVESSSQSPSDVAVPSQRRGEEDGLVARGIRFGFDSVWAARRGGWVADFGVLQPRAVGRRQVY